MDFVRFAEDASFAVFTAEKFLSRKICSFESNVPLIVCDIRENEFEAVKNKIIDFFGLNIPVKSEDGAVIAAEKLTYTSALCVRPVGLMQKKRYSYGDLLEIMRRLRDPDGCPWDKAQTPMSIRTNAIEEAYELVEAVELDDKEKMQEESGDVILQGLFQATIAEESGRFNPNDVISNLAGKLVFRHTHIFGENKADNADEALAFWEKAKAVEKGQRSVQDKLDSVPTTFSALMKANKVQKIIKKTGFDFPTVDGAYDKLYEEIAELKEAKDGVEREKEAGDVLFAAVNVARLYGLDPELALNGSTDKFMRRFAYVEQKAKEAGKKIEDCDLAEMDAWYNEYKSRESK